MKRTTSLILAIFPLLLSAAAFAGQMKRPIALVWDGEGACKESCASAAAHVARLAGFRVHYVNSQNFSPEIFADAAVWVQPGGDAIAASRDMGTEHLAQLRNFVASGGRYVGFCAGLFLSDTWVDDFNTVPGLGITPVVTDDFSKAQLGEQEVILDVNWNGNLRHVYFNTGGTIKDGYFDPGVKIFAYYQTEGLPHQPAAWENTFGNGRVVVTGTHPEAPPKWREDLNKVDTDGDDYDLALDMFQRVMAPRW